ncbi:MAG: type IX secretion system protein PorQ [Bacteroidetes bacterium]|nr:type IX secretion system protein PorQ [Bacteroidota bacterium]
MNKTILILFSLFLMTENIEGQIGGDNIYEFLNLSSSARVTAMGGNLITVRDDDVNLAFANPALLNPGMHQQLSFNHNFHLSDIQAGYATFGQYVAPWKTTFHGGVKYINYGSFDAFDEYEQDLGSFKAAEYAITIGAGREVYERLFIGANVKFISSQFESYHSTGLSGDIAAMYFDTSSNLGLTILFKNIGTQLSTYREGNDEPLPFEMQIGFSKKLKHLPFRFSVIYHHLDRWNILYEDPSTQETGFFIGQEQNEDNRIDNFFRHFIFNGEFLLGEKENFRLRFGYNHFQRQELSIQSYRSLAGFSFGVGLKVNRFRIDYGHAFYHLAGGLNHFSISTNLNEFRK